MDFAREYQSVLFAGLKAVHNDSFWLDPRIYPAYVAALSVSSLALHEFITSKPFRKLRAALTSYEPPLEDVAQPTGSLWKRTFGKTGSITIFVFKFVRLLATLALSALVLYTAWKNGWTWFDIASGAIIVWSALLAFLNAFARTPQSGMLYSFHLTLVTFAVCVLYCYRDIWPLMTFTLRPADEAEGDVLWAKIALLIFVSTVEPLFEPYPYIPVDPTEPMPTPNPEQTSSVISFLFFSFLDPIIWLGYRVPHLTHEQLPPQCDYDYAKNLVKRSYPHMDPFFGAKKRNLFWGIIIVFRRSLSWQSLVLLALALSKLAGPIGTNRLLSYLETGGEDAIVKPWVWILWIVIGPLFNNIFFQLYIYLSTGSLVRVESIITSLVFDHALRIRLKAEVTEKKEKSADDASSIGVGSSTKGTNSPDSGSVTAPESEASEDSATAHSRSTTAASTSTAVTVVSPASPGKGKGADAKKGNKEDEKEDEKNKGKGSNLVGKINNLVTSDLEHITNGRDFLFLVFSAPLQIVLGMAFLYVVLGWSSFVGLIVMIALFPVPALIAKTVSGVQKQKMKATDARVQNVTEMMSVLRMIKLFGWESQVRDTIAEKRENELKYIWKRKILGLLNNITNHTIPLVHMVVTYATFTLIMKKSLSASIVFSSMSAFNMLRMQMFRVFGMLPGLIQANVSLGRVSDFLRNTELLDVFSEQPAETIVDSSAEHKEDIGMGRANFTWSNEPTDGSVTPSRQTFRLRIDDELVFKKGKFNLVVGATGSGKTSLLMALLGEMHYIPLGPDAWVNLPRERGVAYAAQESWVQNETIKENILFGNPYDEERYKKVIYQCGLKRDLTLLEAGDATEVGEKGLTLSGGQKARLTLARAVYSPAEILLLDDVLAALDVHTSRWIVDKCFKGDLLKGRTVILVTHNVAMARPLADFVVSMGVDGHITSKGSASEVLAGIPELAEEAKHEEEAIELDENEDEHGTENAKLDDKSKGKLVVAEEIEVGHVSKAAFMLFLEALGGKWPILFWSQYLTGAGLSEALDSLEMWWLGYWAKQYSEHPSSEVSVPFYLGIYALIVLGVVVFHVYGVLIYTYGSMRASRIIHYKLVSHLLGSTFRWLDVTPTSRVITRCTQDIQAVDGDVAQTLDWLSGVTLSMLARLGAVMLFTPTFVLPALGVAALGGWLGQLYIKAQLSVKREMSTAKAPVLGILGGAIAGLPSIRAYSAQTSFKLETARRVDRYVRAARSFYNLNRWISVRIDALSAIFAGGLAFYLVYGGSTPNPSTIGFIMSMAASFSEMILWWVRIYNEFEVSGNSLERINQYVNIEQEPEPKEDGTPPAYWPSSGDLRVEKLTARYSSDGPKVLQDVSFHIKAGERVGIVGRTGSGKSTLTLSLLRCIYTEGQVYYDGLPTDSMNLDALRSHITIIPQVPELLSGTLRQNLDMFNRYDDAVLNDALRAAGLFSLQRLSDENRLTLDSEIASGGGNLSVGQRQIIALARAIVRQSKLLVLDEATSAIDYETDTVIQSSLRNELKNDVTVITVAHRLQTIMDSDKIMVLDAGRLIEFDSPKVLLQNEKSLLRALVDESADKDTLIAMAEGKAASE